MPIIKVKLLAGSSQVDVDSILAEINKNTAPDVIPSATVLFPGSANDMLLDVNLPFNISNSDLNVAKAAVEANNKHQQSIVFPDVFADENYDGEAVGTIALPKSYVFNNFITTLAGTANSIAAGSLAQNASDDEGTNIAGSGERIVLNGGGTNFGTLFFTVPQQDINAICSWELEFLMRTDFASGSSGVSIRTTGGNDYTMSVGVVANDNYNLIASEGMSQDTVNYAPAGATANGGLVRCGLDGAGNIFIRMLSDTAGTTNVIASQPLGFLGSVTQIRLANSGIADLALDNVKLTINTGM